MNEVLVVGDIHLVKSEPKYSATIEFLDWLFNHEKNNSNNTLILLGDLLNVDSPGELLEIYVDYFLNKSHFKKIIILRGNHDTNLESTIIRVFRPMKNVSLVLFPDEMTINSVNFLFLPHYEYETTDLPSLNTYYSSPIEGLKNNYDYCLTHTEDETNHYSDKFPNLSWIKTKYFLNGHIHTQTITKGGRYLGSPTLVSSTESGKTPYIASINCETKDYSLIEVPKWLEYYSVVYPENLSKIPTKYGIFTVTESLVKNETLEYYQKQSKELGFDFYTNKVISKNIKQDTTILDRDYVEKTDLENFENYVKEFKVDDAVANLCKEVIRMRMANKETN